MVVLAIANATKLNMEELWIAFGVGKHYRYIPIHVIANELGQRFCAALPYFHAFTGCDTVSALAGIGKKTSYQTWKCYSEVTSALCNLSSQPNIISEEDFALIERFVIQMCNRTSPLKLVNVMRPAKRCLLKGTEVLKIYLLLNQHFNNTQREQHTRRDMCGASL